MGGVVSRRYQVGSEVEELILVFPSYPFLEVLLNFEEGIVGEIEGEFEIPKETFRGLWVGDRDGVLCILGEDISKG